MTPIPGTLPALAVWAAIAAGVIAGPASALAADFPTRPVHIIVPSTPGGALDVLARVVGGKLAAKWDQPVTVDNRPGAGGAIGTNVVAKSNPDGTNLVIVSNDFVTLPFLYDNLPYNSDTDFSPVTELVEGPDVLVAAKSAPFQTLQGMVAAAKQKPGVHTFGSSGTGTAGHLKMELLERLAGITMIHVPYKGAGAATIGVVGGEVQALITATVAAIPSIRAGSVVALAVTGAQRSPALPDVPTIAESGFPGYDADGWYGILAPAKTPQPIVDQLYRDIAAAMKDPDVVAKISALGVRVVASSPQEFSANLARRSKLWGPVIKDAHIKGE